MATSATSRNIYAMVPGLKTKLLMTPAKMINVSDVSYSNVSEEETDDDYSSQTIRAILGICFTLYIVLFTLILLSMWVVNYIQVLQRLDMNNQDTEDVRLKDHNCINQGQIWIKDNDCTIMYHSPFFPLCNEFVKAPDESNVDIYNKLNLIDKTRQSVKCTPRQAATSRIRTNGSFNSNIPAISYNRDIMILRNGSNRGNEKQANLPLLSYQQKGNLKNDRGIIDCDKISHVLIFSILENVEEIPFNLDVKDLELLLKSNENSSHLPVEFINENASCDDVHKCENSCIGDQPQQMPESEQQMEELNKHSQNEGDLHCVQHLHDNRQTQGAGDVPSTDLNSYTLENLFNPQIQDRKYVTAARQTEMQLPEMGTQDNLIVHSQHLSNTPLDLQSNNVSYDTLDLEDVTQFFEDEECDREVLYGTVQGECSNRLSYEQHYQECQKEKLYDTVIICEDLARISKHNLYLLEISDIDQASLSKHNDGMVINEKYEQHLSTQTSSCKPSLQAQPKSSKDSVDTGISTTYELMCRASSSRFRSCNENKRCCKNFLGFGSTLQNSETKYKTSNELKNSISNCAISKCTALNTDSKYYNLIQSMSFNSHGTNSEISDTSRNYFLKRVLKSFFFTPRTRFDVVSSHRIKQKESSFIGQKHYRMEKLHRYSHWKSNPKFRYVNGKRCTTSNSGRYLHHRSNISSASEQLRAGCIRFKISPSKKYYKVKICKLDEHLSALNHLRVKDDEESTQETQILKGDKHDDAGDNSRQRSGHNRGRNLMNNLLSTPVDMLMHLRREQSLHGQVVYPFHRLSGLSLGFMRYELLRVGSYARIMSAASRNLRCMELAQQGFYSVGGAPLVRCFSCALEFEGHNPPARLDDAHQATCSWREHNVPLTKGIAGLASHDLEKYFSEYGLGKLSLRYEENRHAEGALGGKDLPSVGMAEMSITIDVSDELMATSDPISHTTKLPVDCSLLNGATEYGFARQSSLPSNLDRVSGSLVSEESQQSSPMLHAFFTSASEHPVSLTREEQQEAGAQAHPERINLGKASYPHYASCEARIKSYTRWSPDHPKRPEHLSKAGFFYAGYADCVRCFYCGLGLKYWRNEDIPEYQHAKFRPNCVFNRMYMGQEYVDRVQQDSTTTNGSSAEDRREGQQTNQLSAPPSQNPSSGRAVPASDGAVASTAGESHRDASGRPNNDTAIDLNTDVAKQALSKGYTRQQVAEAISYINRNLGEAHLSWETLQQKLQGLATMSRTTENTANENMTPSTMHTGRSGDSGIATMSTIEASSIVSDSSVSNNLVGQTVSDGAVAAKMSAMFNNLDPVSESTNDTSMHRGWSYEAEVEQEVSSDEENGDGPHGAAAAMAEEDIGPAVVNIPPLEITPEVRMGRQRHLAHTESQLLAQRLQCHVCGLQPVACVYMPCGHVVACKACGDAAKHCVLCARIIYATANIYLS